MHAAGDGIVTGGCAVAGFAPAGDVRSRLDS